MFPFNLHRIVFSVFGQAQTENYVKYNDTKRKKMQIFPSINSIKPIHSKTTTILNGSDKHSNACKQSGN